MTYRAIAEQLGVNSRTVANWVIDPDGTKNHARKDSYRGECSRCGGPTTGSGGKSAAPTKCAHCRREVDHIAARERVLAKMREWALSHGGNPPSARDWMEKHNSDWPRTSVVQTIFGSWNAAIEAAGFTPLPIGMKRRSTS